MTQITLPTHRDAWFDTLFGQKSRAGSYADRRRHYRIGPVPISMRSEVPGVAEEFHALYERYEVPGAPRDEFHVDIVRNRSRRSGRRIYRVLSDGQELAAMNNPAGLMPHVEWAINGLIARFLPHYFQLHASTMSLDGSGVIFAGQSCRGKSTLAAGLLLRGWSYLSDEFALIDPATGYVVPYPKALCIKAGSFATVGRLGLSIDPRKVHFKGKKGWVSLVNPYSVRDNAVSQPCPVEMIVLPEYRPGRKPELEPISRAQTVFELTHVAFNFIKFRSRGIDLLADVVRRARCYRLWTNDLNATGELLEDAIRAN